VLSNVGCIRTSPPLHVFVDTNRRVHVEALRLRGIPERKMGPRIDVPAPFACGSDKAFCPARAIDESRLRLQLSGPRERDDPTVDATDGEALRRTHA
jgi:hypothetical protein